MGTTPRNCRADTLTGRRCEHRRNPTFPARLVRVVKFSTIRRLLFALMDTISLFGLWSMPFKATRTPMGVQNDTVTALRTLLIVAIYLKCARKIHFRHTVDCAQEESLSPLPS